MATKYSSIDLALTTGWLAFIAAFTLDSFGSSHTVSGLIGLSSTTFGIVYITLLLIARVFYSRSLPTLITNLTKKLLIPTTLILGLSLSIFEYATPANYVYSFTHLNPITLVIFAHASLAVFLISTPKAWYHRYAKPLIFLAPIWLLIINQWTYILPDNVYVYFTIEDGPVETLQNLILLVTIAVTAYEAYTAKLASKHLRALIFAILTLGFLFFLMEEISWGQRIFDISTPDQIRQVNVQHETNFHNIGIFNQLQWLGYIGLSGAGFLLPFFPKLSTIKLKLWQPPINTSWYHALPFAFYVYTTFGSHFIQSEVIEVLFYAGLFIWVLHHSSRAKTVILNHFSKPLPLP